MLHGRSAETARIDELLTAARDGRSGALVIRGEAGVGKTALLDYAAAAAGMRILRGTGIESEAELPFAALQLLAELAGDASLLCVVDDAHWLDRASADALQFAARRLGSEGVVLL